MPRSLPSLSGRPFLRAKKREIFHMTHPKGLKGKYRRAVNFQNWQNDGFFFNVLRKKKARNLTRIRRRPLSGAWL